jgi:hypothetical protein
MKTNSFARSTLRIRAMVLCLAIVGLAVAEVGFGESLAARYGDYTAAQTEAPQASSQGLGDLMAACPVVR